jgi:hypothetical protein
MSRMLAGLSNDASFPLWLVLQSHLMGKLMTHYPTFQSIYCHPTKIGFC